MFGLFLVFYGLFRSMAEFVREPHAGHPLDIGILTPGIVYSMPMILVGLWLIWRARREPALASLMGAQRKIHGTEQTSRGASLAARLKSGSPATVR